MCTKLYSRICNYVSRATIIIKWKLLTLFVIDGSAYFYIFKSHQVMFIYYILFMFFVWWISASFSWRFNAIVRSARQKRINNHFRSSSIIIIRKCLLTANKFYRFLHLISSNSCFHFLTVLRDWTIWLIIRRDQIDWFEDRRRRRRRRRWNIRIVPSVVSKPSSPTRKSFAVARRFDKNVAVACASSKRGRESERGSRIPRSPSWCERVHYSFSTTSAGRAKGAPRACATYTRVRACMRAWVRFGGVDEIGRGGGGRSWDGRRRRPPRCEE